MFDTCQQKQQEGKITGPKCADVAEKLAQLFGWRQTYKVEKLQRTISSNLHTRHASLIKVPLRTRPPHNGSLKASSKSQERESTSSGADSWVSVHNLRSQSGGGILDPDDRLNDVADDREQIIANFEDGDGVHHGGGDGASGSSVGTGSPDIFNGGSDKYAPPYSRTDIEVTGEQIASGLNIPLQVRRGSEPALNQLINNGNNVGSGMVHNGVGSTNGCSSMDSMTVSMRPIVQDPSKRWSAAPIISDDHCTNIGNNVGERNNSGALENNIGGYLTSEEDDDRMEDDRFMRITRDGSNRLSMQFLDGSCYRWVEAAEKAALSITSTQQKTTAGGSKSLPRDTSSSRRKEPLGQANTSSSGSDLINGIGENNTIETIIIRNDESGQLGVHVVPDYDRMGKERGLLVQGIEPNGRIDRHGKLSVSDRIIEINGQPLQNIPFQKVQEIFKMAQSAPELVFKVIKKRSGSTDLFTCKPPAPIYPRSATLDESKLPDDKENVGMVEVEEKMSSSTKLATVSPTKKIPPGSRNPKSLLTANTRRIGRKIELELLKGPHGLGFSITTRDNPAGGNCPIYIKNILPKGAAVEDGRLKPGDRLLEVNGIEMTGKSQAEAVQVLRNAPTGTTVRIVVSRQEDIVTGPSLPRGINSGGDNIVGGSNSGQCNINNTPNSNLIKSRTSPSHTTVVPPAIPPLPSEMTMISSGISNNSNNNKFYNSTGGSVFSTVTSTTSVSIAPTTDSRTGSVAKIISQFQEAANKSNNNHNPLLENKSTEEVIFPWKHREILTFNIPVYDSEKAGLGVSVKGKTTTNQNGIGQTTDLGIFVKNVLNGGAASRDKRLRTNDQLLNVNGISLLHQSNSDAMETLRRAMLHTEGPVPGSITLTIARRVPSPASPQPQTSSLCSSPETFMVGNGNANSSGINSSNENESSSFNTDNSGASEKSGNTVIFLPYTNSNKRANDNPTPLPHNNSLNNSNSNAANRTSFGNLDSWNPVIDRITGGNSIGQNSSSTLSSSTSGPIGLRNESYYIATQDHTWNGSFQNNASKLLSPTVNLPSSETILIENEYATNYPSTTNINRSTKSKSNDNLLKTIDSTTKVVNNDNEQNLSNSTTSSSQQQLNNAADVTYASQLSLENPAGFMRDAFGRQSMSEKRHATLDAKNTGTYQRTKKLREEREKKDKEMQQQQTENGKLIRVGSVESVISVNRVSIGNDDEENDKLGQLGPSLGMKKSSSLESLQTMVQGIQMRDDNDPAFSYRSNPSGLRVVRGRGCDDSFRAAVDVDYKHVAKTNGVEESYAKKHWLLDPPITSTGSNSCETDGNHDTGFLNARGGPRQSSLNAADKVKSAKKKPGLLKGIGSMFRFGKHRKTMEVLPGLDGQIILAHDSNLVSQENVVQSNENIINNNQGDNPSQVTVQNGTNESGNNGEHQSSSKSTYSQSNSQSPTHHYRQIMQQQHHLNRIQHNQQNQNENSTIPTSAASRSHYVQELRALHQKRHAERQGQYVTEQREDQYERAFRQRLDHQPTDNGVSHGRSVSYDIYNDVPRSTSRSTLSANDPQRFSHYVNYDELQHQLSNHKDQLSDVQIVEMRHQVQQQRLKVEEESRRQQHYHSQRQPQRDAQQRPMSNFYEYESVQSLIHASQQPRTTPINENRPNPINKHHFIQHARPYHQNRIILPSSSSSNSSRTHQQRYVSSSHNQRTSNNMMMINSHHRLSSSGLPGSRGPFITHVTIEDQTQKTAGSRV